MSSSVGDRDRLAADLHDVLMWAGMGDFNVVADIVADRLIALGWTRHPLGTEDAIAQYQRMLAASEASADREITRLRAIVGLLDEERLARALVTWWPPIGADPLECAAAIAKAYREDADATD